VSAQSSIFTVDSLQRHRLVHRQPVAETVASAFVVAVPGTLGSSAVGMSGRTVASVAGLSAHNESDSAAVVDAADDAVVAVVAAVAAEVEDQGVEVEVC